MGRHKWHIVLGFSLILMSAAGYVVQIQLFHREQETFFYMLQDLAFLPIQVSLVSLVLNEVMLLREKNAVRHKMNMVIGAFFSEAGNEMLAFLSKRDTHQNNLCKIACVSANWTDKDFQNAYTLLARHEFALDFSPSDLAALKEMVIRHRPCLMSLLSNPNLLEHETFTDLLWATSHLAEELSYRDDLYALPESDYTHLKMDAARAYGLLVSEWLQYVRHLRVAYPYIFSLLVRTNPYAPTSSVIVK